jgi:lysozyme
MNRTELKAALAVDEGCRLKMYLDSLGIETVGFGHNLRDKPISQAAADQIFADDVADSINDTLVAFPWIAGLDDVRANVLLNMSYNMGVSGLRQFKLTLAYVQGGHYEMAAQEMVTSKWATQVGARAHRLAQEMRTGVVA